MWVLLTIFICAEISATTYNYDAYSGCPLSDQEWNYYVDLNITDWCINQIDLPCDPNAYRTLDGTCNNLLYPTRGALRTPFARILEAEFGPDNGIRPTKSGKPPRPARELRVALLAEGEVPHQIFSHLVTHYFVNYFGDVNTIQDIVAILSTRNYCCEERGKSDPLCSPLSVSDDDPVFRFTNIRCLNNTVPITYQNIGCIVADSTPARVSSATPVIDLGGVYGSGDKHKQARLYTGGLLKYDVVDGRIWPPALTPENAKRSCLLNRPPHEVRCHDTPVNTANGLPGANLFGIWVWRLHNFVAKKLVKINPCWTDEKLFETAKDITIAMHTQVLYYEAIAALMGRKNLIRDGVILSNMNKFRDMYDENHIPQIFLETPFMGRYMHIMQPGHTEFFDENGRLLFKVPEVDLTLRTGFFAFGNNMDTITQGAFRQPIGALGNFVSPQMAEFGFSYVQRAADITASDLHKNRHFGFPPYVKYLDFCNGGSHKTFDDLAPYIEPAGREILKNNYEYVEDVDLLAGIWFEKPIQGGHVSSTFYCIMTRQFLKHIQYDRHWYERQNRPHAFTKDQLLEIRKSTIAQWMCDIGDKVTRIQKHAFFRASPSNPLTSCRNIPKVNFEAWRDLNC